jgi:hypothetical protein
MSLAARVGTLNRQAQEVALILVDGTEIRGNLHRAHGTRTLDFLNHQAESFVAMTDATLVSASGSEQVSFVAINKAHIIRVIEAADGD